MDKKSFLAGLRVGLELGRPEPPQAAAKEIKETITKGDKENDSSELKLDDFV